MILTNIKIISSVIYGDKKIEINFPGKICSLTGPNGYGKTMLLRSLKYGKEEGMTVIGGKYKREDESIVYCDFLNPPQIDLTGEILTRWPHMFVNPKEWIVSDGVLKKIRIPSGSSWFIDPSPGEYNTLLFCHYLLSDANLLLLDLPETHVHIAAQQEIKNILVKEKNMIKPQVIYATHSPELIIGWEDNIDLYDIIG